MRIYQNYREGLNEIKRDLAEMGIRIHPQTYQDKVVANDPNFDAFELQNYVYMVTDPKLTDLEPSQPWADEEFKERITRPPVNPGEAWKLRADVWTQFLINGGQDGAPVFAYTYGERLTRFLQVERIINRLKIDPDSRQAFLAIWDASDTAFLGGISRVPCTLGYYFQIRQGQLNMTYLQRSADFATHFVNDTYLATKLLYYMADRIGVKPGHYTHWIGSLHIFKKDVAGVF